MENCSFFVEYLYKNNMNLAEIKPCLNEQTIWYYDVLINNNYQFTISPFIHQSKKMIQLKISLKNADTIVDNRLIEIIGREVEKRSSYLN